MFLPVKTPTGSIRWQRVRKAIRTLGKGALRQHTVRPGALLAEALLSIAVFGLFVTAAFLTLLTGQESSRTGADRVRGVYYTEQAIEVAKSIRDIAFSDLTTGTHGYTLTGATWILSGSSADRSGYDTDIIISSLETDRKRILAESRWKIGRRRSGTTLLTLEVTNWREGTAMGDWSAASETGSITVSGTSPLLNDIVISGNYAYVTSDVTGSGQGMYVFDVSDVTNPVLVNSGFTLGGEAHKPVIYGDVLYVAVESGNEIKAYDISSPTAAFSGDLVITPLATYDLPGATDRGKSLDRSGSGLFVGANGLAGESEFYSFDITSSGSITLLDEIAVLDNGTVNDVFIKGNYAYMATTVNSQEIKVIDISNASSLVEHAGYDAVPGFSNTENGLSVRQSNTGYYLGRSVGASIDEYILVKGSGGTPGTSTYGADLSGAASAMDMDPLGCYAFLATDFASKELQIRDAKDQLVPEIDFVDLSSNARGILYDFRNDLLYVATEDTLHIFEPGPSASTCQ